MQTDKYRMSEPEQDEAYTEHERYSPYLLADSEEVPEGEYQEPTCTNCGDNHSIDDCPFLAEDEEIIDGDVDDLDEES